VAALLAVARRDVVGLAARVGPHAADVAEARRAARVGTGDAAAAVVGGRAALLAVARGDVVGRAAGVVRHADVVGPRAVHGAAHAAGDVLVAVVLRGAALLAGAGGGRRIGDASTGAAARAGDAAVAPAAVDGLTATVVGRP